MKKTNKILNIWCGGWLPLVRNNQIIRRRVIPLKQWNMPQLEELDVSLTGSGGDPSTVERNGYFSGGWHNATYNASEYEKCWGQGTVYRKDIPES